jgi:hypothetical protein
MDKLSDLLRNAKQGDFTVASSSLLYFRLKETPDVESEVSLDNASKILYFYSDKSERAEKEVLARNIESLTFQVTAEHMVDVVVNFKYPRYGSIFSGDPSKGLDGTMQMQIFPRPDTLY